MDDWIAEEMRLTLASLPPVVPVRRKGRITYFRVLTGDDADFAAWECELEVCA
jgi:hypothetical protein